MYIFIKISKVQSDNYEVEITDKGSSKNYCLYLIDNIKEEENGFRGITSEKKEKYL
jgi:hypothetical protein